MHKRIKKAGLQVNGFRYRAWFYIAVVSLAYFAAYALHDVSGAVLAVNLIFVGIAADAMLYMRYGFDRLHRALNVEQVLNGQLGLEIVRLNRLLSNLEDITAGAHDNPPENKNESI